MDPIHDKPAIERGSKIVKQPRVEKFTNGVTEGHPFAESAKPIDYLYISLLSPSGSMVKVFAYFPKDRVKIPLKIPQLGTGQPAPGEE